MHTTTWTETTVLDNLVTDLQTHLPLVWSARKYQPQDIWQSVLAAATEAMSLHQFSRTATSGPHANTVAGVLRQQSWWTADALEERLNRLLQQGFSAQGRVALAIDLHLQPYWGEPTAEVCRGQRQSGSTHFHTYATVCVLRQQRTYTLALTMVRPQERVEDIVARLLDYLEPLNLWVDRVQLDRQFFNYGVIATLQQRQLPFVMPVRRIGVRKLYGGTSRFDAWQVSGWSICQLKRPKHPPVRFDVAIQIQRQEDGSTKAVSYAADGVRQVHPKQLGHRYRQRGGIEAIYRQAYVVRIPTSSADTVYRLLRFGLALVVRNRWLSCRQDLTTPRSGAGGQAAPRPFLPFAQFAGWISRAVRQRWPLRPPETVAMQCQRRPKRRYLYRPVRPKRKVA